jgi:hypothetical protein
LTVNVLLQDIKKMETEALVVGFYEDVRPLKGLAGELDWLLCGALSGLLLQRKVRGSLGEVALLTSRGKVRAQKLFMIGLGPKAGFSPARVRSAARIAAFSATRAGIGRMAIECFHSSTAPGESDLAELRAGLTEGAGTLALDVSVLAPDAASYERILRFAKTWSPGTEHRDHEDARPAGVLR